MNELRHRAEFETALANYTFSERAKQTLKDTKLVLLTAASASGRNTIIKELVATGMYHFIVSDTTRVPRENDGVLEQHGVEYWFRSEEEVLKDLMAGEFLEAELIHGRQVSGISMRELEHARDEHKIAITDVDIGGVQNVLSVKPDTVAILVLPPSFEEWQRRLKGRGTMSDEEFLGRLQTAARIFNLALQEHDLRIIVNDAVTAAAAEVAHIAEGGTPHLSDEEARALLTELRDKTEEAIRLHS